MVASTLSVDPIESITPELGETPGFFQLYTPNDKEVAESFVHRAEAAGFKGIVVTLDTWIAGWRPRDLNRSNFPQLRGHCLANYFTDPVFRSRLAKPPEEDLPAAVQFFARTFGAVLTWADLPWLRSLTKLPLVLKGICHPDDARRAIDGGVDGIYCSTHGGRQANGGVGCLEMLPGVLKAAGTTPVLFDFRRPVRTRHHQGAGAWRDGCGDRPALHLGPGTRRHGRHRPRLALPAGRSRLADGSRRLSTIASLGPAALMRI